MNSWCQQLFGCCLGFGSTDRRNEADWGSTPSVISSAPSTHRSAESVEAPFDPFGRFDHRHLGYLDCHRVERQLCHLYPDVQRDPELLRLVHRPRATLVRPTDLIQALTAWGYSVTAIPGPARQRALHKCSHKEIDVVPSLVPDEYRCIACVDRKAAADGRYNEAHLKFAPLGVRACTDSSDAAGPSQKCPAPE